ncbi:MAG: apses-domain-containing protein [Benniella sp.]|nr:MAG: apses-domain-containing protein [Benniella sp.]
MALVDYGNETPIGTPRGASIEAFDGASVSSDVKSPAVGVETYPSGKPQIFKAIYSGVPVFEMICRGVAVMRRRSDSYLNATQILKVADFDKPQRTRILEREVQKGEHEKVQGGYGKYQGTWVPYDRGLQLCQEYGVLELLQPLLNYESSKVNSPPLAPKHITAATTRPRKPREPKTPGEPKTKKTKLKGPSQQMSGSGMHGPVMGVIDGSTSMDETMSILSARSRTPSPLESRPELSSSEMSDGDINSSGHRRQGPPGRSPGSRKKQQFLRPGDEMTRGFEASSSNQGRYAETLLNYFVSDSTSLPSILVDPPQDLDFDLIIDEEGHTPLHWAVAMARTKIVRLLVQHGADIYRVNNQGQTALMRSVLFTNNFDMKTFATLLEVLQKTIFTIDRNDQTVFHHVAVTAGMRGKVHASRYYMECLLDKLTPHPQELASIINVQDTQGDTALIIAARAGNKKVVKLLLDARADPKIRNRAGLNADEILRDADMQISPAPSLVSSLLATATGHYSGQGDDRGVPLERSSSSRGQAGIRGQGRPLQRMIPQVTELFEQLTEAYEKDLYEKEQDLLNARNMLQETQTEIQEGRKTVEELKSKAAYLGQAEEQIKTLENMIRQEINIRQRLRLESLVTQEEARLKLETEATTTTGGTGDFVERVDALERETVELRSKLAHLQKSRQEQVEQIVQLKSQQGKRRHEYKRLIALCCNVSIDEVDGLLGPLLNTLGNEDGVN